ncbi:MAG TPA: LysR family transcriptional regulator [Burkholderiales bacterium]|nr:LysR family transcriptional regulator [Burkholderiales bacterium]
MQEDLLIFVCLVEIGSFTATAKKYNTSQPTISRRIQALEDSLGVKLINRNSRNVEITPAGQKIYQKLAAFQSIIENTIEEVKNDAKQHKTRLRLALPPTLAFHHITNRIDEFLEQNPNVSLELFFQKTSVDMVGQNLDLAINVNVPASQVAKIKLIKKVKLHLYASKKYVDKYGAPNSLEELTQHTVIGIINPDNSIEKYINAYNLKTQETVPVINNQNRIMTNDALSTYPLVSNGSAIGGAWDDLFFEQLSSGEYVKILPDYAFGEVPFYLIRHSGRTLPIIDKLALFLESCFE